MDGRQRGTHSSRSWEWVRGKEVSQEVPVSVGRDDGTASPLHDLDPWRAASGALDHVHR